MTTFQEPPLQSRRAARHSETADAPPGMPPDHAASNPNGEATTAPASSTAPSASAPLRPEPFDYAMTSRPPVPQYDGQGLRPRRSAETPGHADLPPAEAIPAQDAPSFRLKDYSPEGRRAAAPTWAPPYESGTDIPTQHSDLAPAADTHAPASPAADPSRVVEGTMTRRELRALREAYGMTAVATGEPVALVLPPEAPPAPQPSTRLDSALAEFDALAAGRESPVPAAGAPAPLPGRRAVQQPAPISEASPVLPVESAPYTAPVAPPALDEPFVARPVDDQPVVDGLSAFDALFAASSDELPELVIEPEPPAAMPAPASSAAARLLAPPTTAPAPPFASVPTTAPAPPFASVPIPADLPAPTGSPLAVPSASGPSSVGHWSTQEGIDDAEQVSESTISRSVGVGNGAITTSALVMPSMLEHPIGGPITGTGDILLTGSVSLPQSLSMTGAHPSQLDESHLDHLLDPGDQQVSNTGSTPVRAATAVSTHPAAGGIIPPKKPRGTRGFTVLIIAASAMALLVVGLLVAGFVTGTL